ncbi:MAG: hypothetical protein COV67_06700 [Nitrospinae bacterium CG11_big_fil_rev_8_21_14_0_20_56_8]|nr:MAG: hypothetical protein COV67_06700 [Nitrospinae bacterium CG11_big_fil_rev_8_21_14_0_20_56_8]
MPPKVSVVISVYNGEAYLRECVDSILNQTFTDFEFILLNNGSTDGTPEILDAYADPRIRVVHQENLGIPRALNRGIQLAQGELIARLDADDYSLPGRLERQVRFFDGHPDHVLCGGRHQFLLQGRTLPQWMPFVEEDAGLKRIISRFNPFAHSVVMFRRQTFLEVGGYDEDFKATQDYELWVRLLEKGKGHNLDEVVSVIRLHDQSSSRKNEGRLWRDTLRTRWRAMKKFGGNPAGLLWFFLRGLLVQALPGAIKQYLRSRIHS